MTVLWWLPELPPDPGGIGTFAAAVGPDLVARGHRLHFLVVWGGPSDEMFGDIPVQRMPLRDGYERDLADLLRHRGAVAELKRRIAPSLYHVHLCEPSPVLHLTTAPAAPAPLVVTMHNEMFRRLRHGGDDTLIGRLADASTVITTVSSAAADDFVARRPDLAHRVVVAPNGVTIGAAPPPPPSAPVLLAAGRLVPQKRFDALLKALPAVRDAVPEVRVLIAGEGPERSALEHLAHSVGVDDIVEFLGFVERVEVARLLDRARAVVIPSRYEGMPYVALEAGERGRAVVGTAVGGIDEVVVDGETGLLIDPEGLDDDPAPLAAAIVRVLTEPGLAEQYGAAARERIADRFSVAACADVYHVVYRVGDVGPRPRVSVVIPAWNAERFIGEAIAGVRAQSFTDVEIIVVDDGSTDGTVAAARAAGDDVVVVLRQPHRGIGPTRNAGLAICRGELVAHLDADDLWPPDRLQNMVAALDADPELEAVFGRAVEFADADAPPNAVIGGEPQAARMPSTGLIVRSAHDAYGPFVSNPTGDQIGWSARAVQRGLRYRQIDDVVLRRRIHANNNSHRFPFLADTRRIDLLRSLLHERRARPPADPG